MLCKANLTFEKLELTEHKYPVQIQFDNYEANDSVGACMCQVFDLASLNKLEGYLPKCWAHVIAWDADAKKIFEYDRR